MDALIVVAADARHQLARAVDRGGLTLAQAQQRMAAQLPLSSKIAAADYVIYNDGTLEELERQTRTVHEKILQRFGSDRREGDEKAMTSRARRAGHRLSVGVRGAAAAATNCWTRKPIRASCASRPRSKSMQPKAR